jgi:heme exporter protein D
MEHIIAWFFKVANIRLIVGMCVIYLIFPLFLLPNIINTGNVGPLDLLFWYNHDTLYNMLTSYGETLRSRYIIGLLTADLAYPIYYGSLLAVILTLIMKKLLIPFTQKIIFIPYVAVFFDLTENCILIFLLRTYPTKHNVIADIAGFVTATKWSAFVIIAMVLIYLVVYGLRNRKSAGQSQQRQQKSNN